MDLFTSAGFCQEVNDLKLKDFHPVSIYNIPKTAINKAKYPVIDVHTHNYPKSDSAVDAWVTTMNNARVEKSIIPSYSIRTRFDSIVEKYARYKTRFYIWIAPIHRYVHAFIEKYSDRILYGTDLGTSRDMYVTTSRILETADEHFYKQDLFNYHWPLYGLYLSDTGLKKLCGGNAKRIVDR